MSEISYTTTPQEFIIPVRTTVSRWHFGEQRPNIPPLSTSNYENRIYDELKREMIGIPLDDVAIFNDNGILCVWFTCDQLEEEQALEFYRRSLYFQKNNLGISFDIRLIELHGENIEDFGIPSYQLKSIRGTLNAERSSTPAANQSQY